MPNPCCGYTGGARDGLCRRCRANLAENDATPEALTDRARGLPLELRAARTTLRLALTSEPLLASPSPIEHVALRLLEGVPLEGDPAELFTLLVLDRSWAVARAELVYRAALTCAAHARRRRA